MTDVTEAVTEMPAPINFTDNAAKKVAELIAEEGNPELKLRVFVQGGGCSGFQYGFTFDEVVNDDDTTMTKNGVQLLIDAMSYQYLVGAELERRIEMRAGYINSSLFAATDAAQIPDTVTGKFVDMFSTNVDFRSDLRRGDHFNLVYETFWQNGSYVRAGRILAAEFVNGGKTYQAIWFEDAKSEQGGGYYSFDGKSLKRAFLKSPLEFTRISSGFSMRVHPLTGAWKQHKGIDFAAPTGTPIRAAADGTIEFVGNRGGYGNFIIVKHWKPYSTAYGHMSRFASGIRTGSKVRQGDVIGYVGTTGWSTGPHLHYEFRVNNAQQNPLNIDMPNARPLAAGELQQFRAAAADMEHRFSLLNPGIEKVAMK